MNHKKIAKKYKKWVNIFCKKITCERYLVRDVIVFLVAITGALLLIVPNMIEQSKMRKIAEPIASRETYFIDEQVAKDVFKFQEKIDTSSWKNYENKWYGFEVKYPENWQAPNGQKPRAGDSWEYKYIFRETDTTKKGFDVIVYNVAETKELSNTSEFPKLRN